MQGHPMTGIFEINGMSYFSDYNGKFSYPQSTASLGKLASLGVDTVAVVPTQYTSTVRSSDIHHDPQRTETDANVVKAITDAHAKGMDVVLKPHLDPADGAYRGAYAPADTNAWFANYKTMIVHYADIAQRNGAEMFSVGTEFGSLSGQQYQAKWDDIIDSVRAVYRGPVTYAADWAESGHVSFWNKVDYIGVDAYNPLPTSGTPTVDSLVAAWKKVPTGPGYPDWADDAMNFKSPVDFYHSLSTTYHKPLLFTEIGYRSVDGANENPGLWNTTGTANNKLQADLYEAFFRTWGQEKGDWMKGALLWDWEPLKSQDPTSFSPEDKPAQTVISRYYHQDSTTPPPVDPAAVDTITIRASEDAWRGDAKFRLLVDGHQIGSDTTVTAKHAAGQWQDITFQTRLPADAVKLSVVFLNDDWGGAASRDRNLYVQSATVDGHRVAPDDSTLFGPNETANFPMDHSWGIFG